MLAACLLPLACLLWMNNVSALTTTGSPSICSSQTGIGAVNWSAPGQATASDNSYVTASLDGQITRYLWCNGYGFSVPAGSVINGITINVERNVNRTDRGGAQDASVRVVKNGAVVGNDRASTSYYTTSDVVAPHGGTSDLWGASWTVAEINASNFGAAFAAVNPDPAGKAVVVSVDHIQISVDYTPPLAVISINRANDSPTNGAATVAWTIVFGDNVTGVDATDFALVQSAGMSGATIASVSGSGNTWTVTANVGSGIGNLGLNLIDDDSIVDGGGNRLGGPGASNGNFSGQVYSITAMPKPFCSPPDGAPTGVSCVCDTFGRTTLNPSTIFGANWISSTSDDTGIVPGIVSGRLRLTDKTSNNAKAATVPGIFPAVGNYISVEFQLYAYNGTGADGVAVTLSDYAVPAVPGAFGGSLGYAQKTGSDCGKAAGCPGFAGGWIGVGLDEFGNYSNPTEGRLGGPGAVAQSIGVRGSGSISNGYNWIGGKVPVSSPNIDSRTSSSAAPGHTYQVIVDARQYTPQIKNATVQVNRDTGSGYVNQISIPNIYAVSSGQAPVPDNWQISFTGSTGGSTNIHEIGGVRICAQTIYPPGGGSANDFNAIDEAYGNASASPYVAVQNYLSGHIYTKLMGVPFQLNVAALKDNQLQNLYVGSGSKDVTVKLVDNSDGACVLDDTQSNYCSSTCKAKPAVAGGSQILKFVAADKGQKRSADFTLNTAYRNLVAIVGDATLSACSTDSFAVRPTAVTPLVSDASGTGVNGAPIFKAGAGAFKLTATIPGITNSANGYSGVLKVDSKAIVPIAPATKVGAIGSTFAAAVSGTPNSTALGGAFTYSEVGVIQLPGYAPGLNDTRLRGVYDGVASASECPLASVTPAQCDSFRAATWTGVDSVSAKGDCIADSYANDKSADGKYGCNFGMLAPITLGRFVPNHFDLTATSLKNRNVLACAPDSSFTYMNEGMLATFTLTAKNAGGVTTENYEGVQARLSLSDPANFRLGALDGVSRTNRLAAQISSGTWLKGVASNIPLGFMFIRAPSGPDGSFTPQFGIAPQDSDGITLLPAAYNLDIDAPSPATEHALIGQTSVRFGRLKLGNAFGSEKLDLPIPLEAQYWNGVAFITNTDDSCTPLANANAVLGNYLGSLSASNMGASHVAGLGTLAGGKGGLKLTMPSPSAAGSLDLAIKLGSGASADQSCPGSMGSVTGAGLEYLQSQWCGTNFSRDPRVRIRFGTYKNANQMIYMREMY
jgi:MSHA biogenesis protein MshQ